MNSSDASDDEDDIIALASGKSITRSNRIDKILDPFISLHNLSNGGKNDAFDLSPSELHEIRDALEDGLRHRSQTCLICIETLKSTEAVWSCLSCYTVFHLTCIQSWSRHGLAEAELRSENESPDSNAKTARWNCPKCRNEYDRGQCPREYRCFCGQVSNPKPDPWLLPHSCGQTCHRQLIGCEHTCLLLCHPGPCPLCPKTVMVSCHCGKMAPTMRRCGQKSWSCGKACEKILACGIHKCGNTCHVGPCGTCNAISQRPCVCGCHTEMRPCAEGRWRCDIICGRQLSCKRHACQEKCHEGACQPCGGGRFGNTCPCGKTVYDFSNIVSCIDELRPCGDTCGKMLDCGVHYCIDRCHKGACPSCMQERVKRCRCGLKEKLMPCSKEFQCDVKCKNKRQCGRHPCNRRCCDGGCPPCEQTCGRTLQCGKHKCQAPCHRGLCYPCIVMAEVKCRCGKTSIKVPCGAEKRTKTPRCRQLCSVPPDCHHERRDPHACHFGDCPPCRQVCEKGLEKCGHSCQAICHSAVLMDVNAAAAKRPAATPLEKVQPKFERVQLECPPCYRPVPVTCIGEHETANFPCSDAKPYSCGRPCGRPLSCGNHKCTLLCHDIDKEKCQECTEPCTLPRPADCTHPCIKPCHPAPCAPCRQLLRRTCHCGLNQKYIACIEWNRSDEHICRNMIGCGNPCPKFLVCGHQCTLECHEGACSSPENCERKVTVRCPCGRRSSKAVCSKIRKGLGPQPTCDEECNTLAESKKKSEVVEDTKQIPKDIVLGPRRRRKQKVRSDDNENSGSIATWFKENNGLLLACAGVVVLALFTFWLLS